MHTLLVVEGTLFCNIQETCICIICKLNVLIFLSCKM